MSSRKRKTVYYTIEFDGSNTASGVYFYKLSAKDFTAAKKMNLIK